MRTIIGFRFFVPLCVSQNITAKMFFCILFALVFGASSLHAQHWQDSTVAVPESVFPIGGINFGLGDFHDSVNSLKEAGFNMEYERAPDYGIVANIKAMTHGLKGYMSMGNTLNNYIGAYYGGYFPGSETRFFLSSNDHLDFAHDTVNNWDHKAGALNANIEWSILDTMGIPGNTNYVLTDLQVDPNSLTGYLGKYITWPQTDSVFCDFIFRIDTIRKSPSTWDSSLYIVEYYLKDVSNAVTTYFDTITVNKQLAFLRASNRDVIEHKHIVTFPSLTLTKNPLLTENYYARIRQVIPIHVGSYQAKSLEVKLRTFHNANIFIRGLRIRSHLAEQVLTGQKDSTLDTVFRAIRDTLNNNGIFSTTPFITAGGETQTPSFRVYSYLDDRCNKKIGKHIVMFLAEESPIRFPWYRSIYEDQTDSIPPPLQAECAATFYHYPPLSEIARDCIPDSIFHLPNFTTFGLSVDPANDSGYRAYTSNFQNRSGWCSKLDAALTAHPPGKTPGKWYGMIAALLSFDYDSGAAKSASASSVVKVRDSLVARMRRGIPMSNSKNIFNYRDLVDTAKLTCCYRIPFSE